MAQPQRFSLHNVMGRDDDVEDVHIRSERELRRRLRESDPTYTQKRLEANKAKRDELQQQQQYQSRGPMTLPTPEQAVLDKELESKEIGTGSRSTLLLRQDAVQVYPTNSFGETKKSNMARWMDVADSGDAQNAQNASGRTQSNNATPDGQQQQQGKEGDGNTKSRGRPTFIPDAHLTQGYARRCIEVAGKTAAIRYRDVCNAKTPDEMGALGIDPAMMGNFGNAMDTSGGGGIGSPMMGVQSAANPMHLREKKLLPDNFHGVPTRGDSDARLIAYRRMKEKDKMASAQRQLLTAQARLDAQKEMDDMDIPTKKDADSDDEKQQQQQQHNLAQYNTPAVAQEVMDDCGVYLKDSNAAVADPGYPLPMRLGTVDNVGGGGIGSPTGGFTGSGIDMSATDNEDLLILTTPQLRLASKCVLQCIFSLQAADLRSDSVPTLPLLQFVPVRHCPMFVQKEHTLMVHELKDRLRKGMKEDTRPKFVAWTRVLLSRSADPEDDIIAADDVHVATMAHASEMNAFSGGGEGGGRGSGDFASPHSGSRVSAQDLTQQKHHFGGTLNRSMARTDALVSGAASVDVMVSSPPHGGVGGSSRNSARRGSMTGDRSSAAPGTPEGRLVAISTAELAIERAEKGQDVAAVMNARRNRPPPAMPVLVRAPRPILVKPSPSALFDTPAPSANEIAGEFREFSKAIRPLLEQAPDPPGGSKNDPDRTPTDADLDGSDGSDMTDEEVEVEEEEEEEVTETQADGTTVTTKLKVRRPRLVIVRRRRNNGRRRSSVDSQASSAALAARQAAEEAERKAKSGVTAWEKSRGATKQLSMEEIYEAMKEPTVQQMEQLLSDSSPFEDYETAAMTARAISKKMRHMFALQQQEKERTGGRSGSARSTGSAATSAGGGGGSSVITLDGSDGERLRFRLNEALDYIKQHTIESTGKLTRAMSAIEFRFKMQESFLEREVETSGFSNSAKGIINADQRITLLERRMQGSEALELLAQQREAAMEQQIKQDREVRKMEKLREEQMLAHQLKQQEEAEAAIARRAAAAAAAGVPPPGRQGSPSPAAYRRNSPNMPGRGAVAGGGTPQRSPSAPRRVPEPVQLKYAKREAENAPDSLSNFITAQRDASIEKTPEPTQPSPGNSPQAAAAVRKFEPVADEIDDAPTLVQPDDDA